MKAHCTVIWGNESGNREHMVTYSFQRCHGFQIWKRVRPCKTVQNRDRIWITSSFCVFCEPVPATAQFSCSKNKFKVLRVVFHICFRVKILVYTSRFSQLTFWTYEEQFGPLKVLLDQDQRYLIPVQALCIQWRQWTEFLVAYHRMECCQNGRKGDLHLPLLSDWYC